MVGIVREKELITSRWVKSNQVKERKKQIEKGRWRNDVTTLTLIPSHENSERPCWGREIGGERDGERVREWQDRENIDMHGGGNGRRQRQEEQRRRGGCTSHMQWKRKKLRKGRGEKRRDRYTGFSRNESEKSQGPQWQGEGRGLNRDQFMFAQLCIAEWICYGWMSLFSGYMCCQKHWKPAENRVCVRDRDVSSVLDGIWGCRQTGDWG